MKYEWLKPAIACGRTLVHRWDHLGPLVSGDLGQQLCVEIRNPDRLGESGRQPSLELEPALNGLGGRGARVVQQRQIGGAELKQRVVLLHVLEY